MDNAKRGGVPVQRWMLSAVLLVAGLGLVGCGADASGDAAEPRTVTQVVTVAEAAATQPADDAGEPKQKAAPKELSESHSAAEQPAEQQPAEQPAEEAEVPADGGCDGIVVPDVVGTDHQLAQDTMQAAGLYNLAEEDATGQGRMLLWDRNWTVVEQAPSAGSCAREDTTIILASKKDGE